MHLDAEQSIFDQCRLQAFMVAAIFDGKDLDNLEDNKDNKTSEIQKMKPTNVSPSFPIFEHPDKYKHMTPEERKNKTEQMMGMHKVWADSLTTAKAE